MTANFASLRNRFCIMLDDDRILDTMRSIPHALTAGEWCEHMSDSIANDPWMWQVISRSDRTALLRNALNRMARNGQIERTLDLRRGREVRVYEAL